MFTQLQELIDEKKISSDQIIETAYEFLTEHHLNEKVPLQMHQYLVTGTKQ